MKSGLMLYFQAEVCFGTDTTVAHIKIPNCWSK